MIPIVLLEIAFFEFAGNTYLILELIDKIFVNQKNVCAEYEKNSKRLNEILVFGNNFE